MDKTIIFLTSLFTDGFFNVYVMKIFTVILICILSSMYAFGQTIELTGQVTDEKTGEGLTGVSVQLKSANSGTITGAQGRFSFQVTKSANYKLTFSYLGYQTKTI